MSQLQTRLFAIDGGTEERTLFCSSKNPKLFQRVGLEIATVKREKGERERKRGKRERRVVYRNQREKLRFREVDIGKPRLRIRVISAFLVHFHKFFLR